MPVELRGQPSNSGREMDDPSIRAIVGPRKAGEEDTTAEQVEPSHAITAWVPLGAGLEILCSGSHHRWWECFALLPCRDLAEP